MVSSVSFARRRSKAFAIFLFPLFMLPAGCPGIPAAPLPDLETGAADPARSGSGSGAESRRDAAPDPFPTLSTRDICIDAGYLCAFLLQRDGESRVARWPDATGHLTIRVPLPGISDPVRAEELRRAVIRGLLAWDGRPFPLRVVTSDGGEIAHPDFDIAWIDLLDAGEAGRVMSGWEIRGASFTFRVARFELALRIRDGGGGGEPRPILPDAMERIAAHEMGHALGLGHSDDPRDLMYPINRGAIPSPRDYRTLHALHGLPAGARVVEND